MLEMVLEWHELRGIAKVSSELYLQLKEYDQKIATLEDIIADKGYCAFSCYVNDVESLPSEILSRAKFKALQPLKIMSDSGIKATAIKDLIVRQQVHLPDNKMLDLKEIYVETDACTDSINGCLQDGWRIVAVLPQCGQRRPDYVLGR